MIAILSPAKNMTAPEDCRDLVTRPAFGDRSALLLEKLRGYCPWELEKLLKVNSALGEQACYYFTHMDLEAAGTPAILTYDGLVFKYFRESPITKAALKASQDKLRVLSGFYGILKPLDGIMPYRLEMQTPLAAGGCCNLYEFWGDSLYRALYAGDDAVINLASEEYARTIRRYLEPGRIFVDVVFQMRRGERLRTITTYAKMARGAMARFIVEEGIDIPEGIRDFDGLGFRYDPARSSSQKYIFVSEK
jgi:cytoplasmic iron level regulating protein YaaA (DUF328/UPF0246 family)